MSHQKSNSNINSIKLIPKIGKTTKNPPMFIGYIGEQNIPMKPNNTPNPPNKYQFYPRYQQPQYQHYPQYQPIANLNNQYQPIANLNNQYQPITNINNQSYYTNTHISSYDVLLKEIHVLDKMKPILSEHLYSILFRDDETLDVTDIIDVNDLDAVNKKSKIIDYSIFFEEHTKTLKFEKFIEVLAISSVYDRYKKLFLNNDNNNNNNNAIIQIANQIIDQTTDISTNYDISEKTNANTIVSIPKKTFLELSLETYPNDTAIIRQYLLDIPRQDVYINGFHIENIDNVISILGKFNKDVKINVKGRETISILMLTLALTCQSSFFMSFVHLHNKCVKMHDGISNDPEFNKNDNIDPRLNMHVCDSKDKNVISIHVTENSYKCSFGARYKVINVTTSEMMYEVNTEILLDLDNDNGLIVYETI